MNPLKQTVAAAALALAAAGPAFATATTDPANDFISAYTGVYRADLDILSTGVFYDGANFNFTATLAGTAGATANGVWVLGFNRGAGVATFAAAGLDGVLFDAVVRIGANGAATVGGASVGTASGFGTSSTISLSIAGSALASTGFAPGQYTWNFWTRGVTAGGAAIAGNAGLADFAPNNSNLNVPEPASLALVALALAGLARTRRTRG